MPATIEERFGPYRVFECIGMGGIATVHRAVITRGDNTTRELALKRLLPQLVDDKTHVDDFLREGEISSRLHHPYIIKILDLGRVGPTHFIAMELIDGPPLYDLVRAAHAANRPAPVGVVIALISELCDALDYACNGSDTLGDPLNIIHRDLSPSNLLIAGDGHLRIIDFGAARGIEGQFATSSGLIKGKLGYMSIEAIAGHPLDGRADVYSAGVVAWELLTGRRLFAGANEMETVQRIRNAVVPPPSHYNPACPPTLDGIVLQACARKRDARTPTAAVLRDSLELVRRAYREDATAGEVLRWRNALIRDSPVKTPARQPALEEQTQRRPAARLATEIEPLLELEPAPAPAPVADRSTMPWDVATTPSAPAYPADAGGLLDLREVQDDALTVYEGAEALLDLIDDAETRSGGAAPRRRR